MPIYITQGRYTRDAIKGMIVKPEDRADAVSRAMVQGRRPADRLLPHLRRIRLPADREAPGETQMAAVLLAAAGSGGVTDLRTTVAMTSVEAKGAFAAAADLAPGFKSAGGT